MVFYNHTHIYRSLLENSYITNHTKTQPKTVSDTRIAWRFRLTARQFMTEPKILGTTDVLPSGTFMPAGRFLGKNPEFCENNVIQQGGSCNSIHTITTH